MNEAVLREQLVTMLRGGEAHVAVEEVLARIPPEIRSRRPPGGLHSIWELLEHMRIAQEDILRYMLDPQWQSPPWPEGYWPDNPETVSDEQWEETVRRFRSDLEAVIRLVQDPTLDLTAPIPHAPQHTYLREVLLVADHNAYHMGQIIDIRRIFHAWPPR